ncbi:hypothetical protein FBU31_004944, partial [Coemansia sp. 'formosensis']
PRYFCRVSSVYDRHGKKHLFDKKPETCWNSAQGTPQHIDVQFKVPVKLTAIRIQFQGGFAGKATNLFDLSQPSQPLCPLHPKDNNSVQVLLLPESLHDTARSHVRIQFLSSTDFYGRIVVYALDFLGHAAVALQTNDDDSPIGVAVAAA